MALAKILTVPYQQEIFHINVSYKNITNIYLKFSRSGQICLTAPLTTSEDFLLCFIQKHLPKFAKASKNYLSNNRISLENKYLFLLDKKLEIKLILSKKNKFPEIINNNIYLFVKSLDDDSIWKAIKCFYTKVSQDKLTNLTIQIAATMNQNPSKISIKWLTSKWGSCQYKSKEILLSSQLMAHGEEVIKYVIVHELSHLFYPNHSQSFWKKVEEFCPNYKTILKVLKNEEV